MQYYFKKYDKVPDTLLFAKKEEIFSLNFETLEITTLHKFSPPLLTQPLFMSLSENQEAVIVASSQDCYYVNLATD